MQPLLQPVPAAECGWDERVPLQLARDGQPVCQPAVDAHPPSAGEGDQRQGGQDDDRGAQVDGGSVVADLDEDRDEHVDHPRDDSRVQPGGPSAHAAALLANVRRHAVGFEEPERLVDDRGGGMGTWSPTL